MKIEFSKSGGFLGQTQEGVINGNELTEEQRNALEEMEKLISTKDVGSRDGFQYHLRVKDGRGDREIELDDSMIIPEITPLIEKMEKVLRDKGKQSGAKQNI